MRIEGVYRNATFYRRELGGHLLPWSKRTERRAVAHRTGHHAAGSVEEIMAYCDWLIHRHPRWPYWLRRICLPAGILIPFYEQVLAHQEELVRKTVEADMPLITHEDWLWFTQGQAGALSDLESFSTKPVWALPMMRLARRHAQMIKERQRVLERLSELGVLPEGGVLELWARFQARSLDLGFGLMKRHRALCKRQARLDQELSLIARAKCAEK